MDKKKTISIIYICVGKYVVFWRDFYLTCEKYLLPSFEKRYFVFSDASSIPFCEQEKVSLIYQEDLGWPGNTLMRFHMMKKVINDLLRGEYVYFFNANLLFTQIVGEEILPQGAFNFVGAKHPGMYCSWKKNDEFPYSRDCESNAFIPYGEGETYYQGALFGGKTGKFVEMIDTLTAWIDEDLSHNIIPIFHDESILNKYFLGRSDVKVLEASYIYPEGWKLPCPLIVMSRDKSKYFNVDRIKYSLGMRILNRLKLLVNKFRKRR